MITRIQGLKKRLLYRLLAIPELSDSHIFSFKFYPTVAIQADLLTQRLSAQVTGQEGMLGTSVIRDTLCLVPPSECVCPAENGAEIHRHVRVCIAQRVR